MQQKEAVNLFRNKATLYGFIADESRYPERRILTDLKLTIAAIKKAKIDANQDLAPHDIMTLPCIEMFKLDRVDCPSIPPSGLFWMRSTEKIPRYIKILDINTLLGNDALSITPWNRLNARITSRNRYVQGRPLATLKNDNDGTYLYALNSELEALTMTFIPEDYEEAILFPKCGVVDKKLKCNPFEIEIGADFDTIDKALDILVKKEAQIVGLVQGYDVDSQGRAVN